MKESNRIDNQIFYKCDPAKNVECEKGIYCYWQCFYTLNKEYSIDGKPLTLKEREG